MTRWLTLSLLLAAAMLPSPAVAQKSKLSPAKVKQIKKTRKSFDNCRKEALEQLKQGAISKKKFEVALNTCQENFPGASLYITCKKSAIKTAESQNISADQAIDQCKRYLLATQFDEAQPLPFFVEAGQFYFSGIGLNKSIPAASLDPPNFDCEKLQAIVKNPKDAQYFLFGNHPRVFAGLEPRKGPALMKTLRLAKPSSKGADVSGFGRVFGDPRGAGGVVFFPSSSCDFDADPGDIFAGLSAYYLLDAASSTVTPYFGIAYYKQGGSPLSTSKLVAALVRSLGSNFKAFKKNELTTFVAAAPVSETDDEQDPKNLCRTPRAHRFVGVVQGRKDAPTQPEYLILANVKNLCEFGDKLGKRLTE
jgi:hypothetical protein